MPKIKLKPFIRGDGKLCYGSGGQPSEPVALPGMPVTPLDRFDQLARLAKERGLIRQRDVGSALKKCASWEQRLGHLGKKVTDSIWSRVKRRKAVHISVDFEKNLCCFVFEI